MRAVTRYAKSGDLQVAYQAFGTGEADLVLVHGLLSHIDLYWDWPISARFLELRGSDIGRARQAPTGHPDKWE